MDIQLISALQSYGLSEKESKVYLTVLELGNGIVSTIARRSGIKRVTAYTILEDLKKKWIATETTKDDIKYYSVIDPDNLLSQLEQKYESFKAKMPEFLAVADTLGNKPKIQFFEGVTGLKHLYNELLKHKQPLFSFLSDDDIDVWLQQYLNKTFITQRKKQGIHASVIVRDTKHNKEYLASVKKDKLTVVRLVGNDFTGIEWELILFGENRIACAMYSSKELSGFIIESNQLYASLKSIFMFMWNQTSWQKKK